MKESTSGLAVSDFKYLEYAYGDSSVPPEYHRSFKIRITDTSLQIVVDSYGDILTDKTFKLKPEDFKEILTSVKKIDFKRKYPELSGCTGGVSKSFTLETAKETYQTSVYYCGNKPEEKLTKELDHAASIIVSKVPKLEELLKR